MINFQCPAFLDVNNFCNKHLFTELLSQFLAVHVNFILVGLFCIHRQLSFGHMLTFIHYIKLYFMFVFLDCVCWREDFIKSRFIILRFCSIHFIVILYWAEENCSLYRGLCYIENHKIKSRFHCSTKLPCWKVRAHWDKTNNSSHHQGAKKVSSTACHLGKLLLAHTGQKVISNSPQKISLRSRRFHASSSKTLGREQKKKEWWGRGRGEKETLARKPLDFEKLHSPTNAAFDWGGAGSVDYLALETSIKPGLRVYVRRRSGLILFVVADCKCFGLIFTWIMFVRRFITSESLPSKSILGDRAVETSEGQFIGKDGVRIWLGKMDCLLEITSNKSEHWY